MSGTPNDLLLHRRILASAGSGKTYQLTNRYLTLIKAGAEPGAILASTFTRLAAGQIRNRILMRLAEAVDDPKKRKKLAQAMGESAMSPTQTMSMLATLARNVHRLNLRTLDSFFASIVTAFSLELGIPPGARVIDETETQALRTEAMRRLLDERDPQKLITLLRLLTQGAANRSIMTAIDRSIGGLYERYLETPPEAWECIEPLPMLTAPELEELILQLETLQLPDKKSLIKAKQDDLRRLYERDWPAFLSKGIAAKVFAGEETFSRTPIPLDVYAIYEPLVSHAKAIIVNLYRDQTLATRDLLAMFDEQYEKLKRRDRVLTFADLTHAMLRAESLGSLTDICYRIDASIQHLLLDEFQDTSVTQWRALKPFINEVVANAPPDHTFFCVGDVKQSIYGWRDAAPEVLERLPHLLEAADDQSITTDTLDMSWRSAPPIMAVLNSVFESLPQNDALGGHPRVAETWHSWFSPHTTALKNTPGYAELRFAPRIEGADKQDTRLKAAADLVAELHAKAPAKSIAMLTRSNKTVARLLFLLQKSGVPASGRGGGPLTDTPPVNVILDVLRLADHPDDTIAAFNVGASPLGSELDVDPSMALREGKTTRHRFASDIRRDLLEHGYATTIDGWIRSIARECDERQLRRLLQLTELAQRFDGRGSLRPGAFVDLVEISNVAESKPAPVQIMTVHQAKGMEYDIVVLADLESSLTGAGTPDMVFEREGTTGPVKRICRYISKDMQSLVPDLAPLFEQQLYRVVRETLCVLYVAMTRAKQGLFMILDPPRENEKALPQKVSGILRFALASSDATEPDSIVYQKGDLAWLDEDPKTSEKETESIAIPVERIELKPSSQHSRPGLKASPASDHSHEIDLAQRLTLGDDEPLDRGLVIHAMFEQIQWLEDFTLGDDALASFVRRLKPRRSDHWVNEQIANFRTMLVHHDVRRRLSRGDRNPDSILVWRELPFATIIDDRLHSGFIDRLEVEMDSDGNAIRASVIDFKTDGVIQGTAKEHAEQYRHQLENYRQPAADRAGLPPEAIDLTVLFTTTGEAVSLSPSPSP
ncbi:MAG: UvrD-helicase domain-containing protein [Planctomycetota bacterium]|nr:UvrD-helicase domain-containing protein [Planctomycetota bacterium]